MAPPYTLPGSWSHRLAKRLAATVARWQMQWPYLGRPLVQLVVSSIFALALATQLGKVSLALAILSLAIASGDGFMRRQGASSAMIMPFVPLTLAWLLGHAAYGTIEPLSVVVAAAFATTLSACRQLRDQDSNHSSALIWQVGSQVVVAAGLVLVQQPLVAAAVALLVTPQVLLVPLLSSCSYATPLRDRYFNSIQFSLLISMFLTALALGYRS